MNLFLLSNLYKHKQILKYLLAGGMAASTDIILLFIFTDIFKIWYLMSAVLAFIFAFFVSFYLQKFWTFRDKNKDKMYSQMTVYLITAVINLGINTYLMFLFVDKLGIWYIFSQIMAGIIIATESFLIYKFIIFKNKAILKSKGNIPEKLKVLIATGIYPPDIGGPATYSFFLKKELENLDCDVKILTYAAREFTKDEEKIYGINRTINIFTRYIKFFILAKKLSEWADLVYILDLVSAGLPATIAAKLNGKKVVFRTGGDFLWEKAFQKNWTNLPLSKYYEAKKNFYEKILIKFCRWLLINIDLVIFSTKLQAEVYQKYYNLPANKLKIIANALPEIKVNEVASGYENKIIFAGRLVNLKNLHCLIKVFSQIKNNGVKLAIFGDGPEKKNLENLIDTTGQNNRVKILSSVNHNDLIRIIKGSLFVILPSVTEISPNLAYECLSLGKPIIVTKETGLGEEIMKKLITIDPLSEEDMKIKIENLLAGDNLDRYADNLKLQNVPKRPWRIVAQEHLNIFKLILNE